LSGEVKVAETFSVFGEHWSPKVVVGGLNGQHVKLVKLLGEFVWHHHDEDEMFFMVKGRFRDRSQWIEAGELIVVPEPMSTLNAGNVAGN